MKKTDGSTTRREHAEKWIRDRAYFRWLEAGQPDGRSSKFWLLAEQDYRMFYDGCWAAWNADALLRHDAWVPALEDPRSHVRLELRKVYPDCEVVFHSDFAIVRLNVLQDWPGNTLTRDWRVFSCDPSDYLVNSNGRVIKLLLRRYIA